MDDSKVLSTEEVDALLKAAQDKESDLTKLLSQGARGNVTDGLNQRAITNITELTWCETEKLLSSLLRKKITIRPHESKFGKLAECLDGKLEKHAYSVFHLSPNNAFGLTAL